MYYVYTVSDNFKHAHKQNTNTVSDILEHGKFEIFLKEHSTIKSTKIPDCTSAYVAGNMRTRVATTAASVRRPLDNIMIYCTNIIRLSQLSYMKIPATSAQHKWVTGNTNSKRVIMIAKIRAFKRATKAMYLDKHVVINLLQFIITYAIGNRSSRTVAPVCVQVFRELRYS